MGIEEVANITDFGIDVLCSSITDVRIGEIFVLVNTGEIDTYHKAIIQY